MEIKIGKVPKKKFVGCTYPYPMTPDFLISLNPSGILGGFWVFVAFLGVSNLESPERLKREP